MYNSIDPRAAGLGTHPINYILIALLCINSIISCNICVFEVYKGQMGHAILISSRNFPVKTDRWAAAVVAIDQLPRQDRERDRHET
jgi:hypothetical protein